MPGVQVGQEAPDFTLKDDTDTDWKLSDQRGQKVVLMFFPFAFSPVCQTEMCDVRDLRDDFAGSNAKVVGISRDSIWSLKTWKEQQGLNQTFLSDLTGDVARAYDAWNEDLARADRVTVIVDESGKVIYTTRTAHGGIARDHQEALAAVRGG
ncbi:MAG: peroxiredoxin [Chloroflexi bacterium]|nr:peroxiredoxin [Chloroflexota bacterium]